MYGGSVDDYLPDVEISSATDEVYRVFSDMATQWRVNAAGGVSGLDYGALDFILKCHNIAPDAQLLRDIRVLEQAAMIELNKKE